MLALNLLIRVDLVGLDEKAVADCMRLIGE